MRKYLGKGNKQKLIINADDYGMSPLFNRGILKLASKGLLTSVSVMIKRKYVDQKEMEKLADISWGLHLELGEKSSQKEIENQINRFRRITKKLPSHLDSHYHSHLNSFNLPLVLEVAKKYNLPVRSYLNKGRRLIKKAGIKTPDRFLDWQYGKINKLKDKTEMENRRGFEVTELVFHPGYHDENSSSSYNREREKELLFMESPGFRGFLNRFELINYRKI